LSVLYISLKRQEPTRLSQSQSHSSLCADINSHPANLALHTGAIRPRTGFMESLFFIWPHPGHGSSKVLEMLPAFSFISWTCAFCAGDNASIFFSGPVETEGGTSGLSRRAGSSGISWRILSLVKEALRLHRAGFEPQRVWSFVRRVKAPKVLGEAVRA
jgi:hypothetical protein